MAYQISNKRKLLLANKEEILKDIKYFEKRIEEARSQKTNSSYFDDDDDSDSDILLLDMGPSVSDLKLEQGRLQTCLNATQELTNLCVLQSEDNVLVNDPVYEKEPLVTEQGTWREVTADCRVDLVPFSITFYTHQPSRPFGPTSYRGLRVLPVKTAHENELSKSILPRVDTPSEAVEVLRNYSVAHRSRRTTLARLAEKYPNSLFMEPLAEGGYVIKCANLLEVSWTLENKWSPIAAFHHRMKFDLEYMDEAYVKIISQAHRELSDPTLETDERTRLMSKIIATCLQAQGPNQELYESMESDIESENLRKRRTTLDEEIEEPINKKKKDSEIMAPPKSIPKKTKAKGKENNADNKRDSKGVKRSVTENADNGAKKAKFSPENLVKSSNFNAKNKVGKEIATLNKVTESMDSNNGDKVSKAIVSKEDMNSKSNKDNNVAKTKKNNKDNVVKKVDASARHHIVKENLVISSKASETRAASVKNIAVSSQLENVKKTDGNIKDSQKLKNVKESEPSKKNIDKQNVKIKSVNQKKLAHTENPNKLSLMKSNKMSDNIPNKETEQDKNTFNNNQNPTLSKLPSNVNETNSGVSKVLAAKDHNVKSRSQNVKSSSQNVKSNTQNDNENPRKTKVSSGQSNIGNKDVHLKTIAKVSDKKNKLKAKSTDNVKESITNKGDHLNLDSNTNKKKVIKSKSMERPKTTSLPENLNAENIASIKKKTININTRDDINVKESDRNIKTKSKAILNDNVTKTKPSKSNKEDMLRKSNKPVLAIENIKHVTKENVTNSGLSNKTDLNKGKTVNNIDSALKNLKQDDKQLKVVVQNINVTSRNMDKITEKIDRNNILTEKNNIANVKKLADKNEGVSKKIQTDINKFETGQNNDNIGRNLIKQKKSSIEQFQVTNDNSKSNAQSIKRNVTSNKNVGQSKSPIPKNKINILNARNKISIDKLKVTNKKLKDNDLQKDKRDKNKLYTKIPQKLMSVREQVIKKNPLRISPRKINSNLKTDSQNSSRSSQRSLQKPMTGIPRLMKKPIARG